MKMILTAATTPDDYVNSWTGWQGTAVQALRSAVREAEPELVESLKWGHLLYSFRGPVLIIRAEPQRVLFGLFRGKRLLEIEPRMKGSGEYELRTLQLQADTPLDRSAVVKLVKAAKRLNAGLGSPQDDARSVKESS